MVLPALSMKYYVVKAFRGVLRRQGPGERDDIMTYAQQLLAEGEAKGRAEGEAPEPLPEGVVDNFR